MYSYGPPHMAEQKQDDQLEHTYSSSVRIRDVALKTCQRWWTIGKSGERGSGISVLAARHDDDLCVYQTISENLVCRALWEVQSSFYCLVIYVAILILCFLNLFAILCLIHYFLFFFIHYYFPPCEFFTPTFTGV